MAKRRRARIGRRVAHLLGWHTPECLRVTAPGRLSFGPLYPECAPPRETVARVVPMLGWHRWIRPGGAR